MKITFQTPILLLLLCSAGLAAQEAADTWVPLRSIPPGTPVRVTLASRTTVSGFLLNAADDFLVVRTSQGEETLSRRQVGRVQVRREGHRGRNTLLGFGIGTATGFAIGAGADAASDPSFFPNAGKVVFSGLGAILGTVIGVAMPTGGWHDVYRAR